MDKSLLAEDRAASGSRFRMLETIREYALEQLEGSGEWEAEDTRRQHALYFLTLAEKAEPHLQSSRQVEWLDRLQRDHDNMRAALRWSLSLEGHGGGGARPEGESAERVERVELGLRLAGALWWFWEVRSYSMEGRDWLVALLSRPEASPRTAIRARALAAAARVSVLCHDYTEGRRAAEEGLAIWRDIGDKRNVTNLLLHLGFLAVQQHDGATARSILEECLAIRKELGDVSDIGEVLAGLSYAMLHQSDFSGVTRLFEEYETLVQEAGHQRGLAMLLFGVGHAALHQGRYKEAEARFKESLELSLLVRDMIGVVYCVEGLGALASAQGQARHAAKLFAASDALFEVLGLPANYIIPDEHARHINIASARLGEQEFETAWAEGRAMAQHEGGLENISVHALQGADC